MDRFDCYELCVQSPRHVVGFLRRADGREPTILREDFCGTAAICRRWIDESRRAGQRWKAIGVDMDPEVIARAGQEATKEGFADAIDLLCADVLVPPVRRASRQPASAPEPIDVSEGCDIIFVGNFSIGYLHDRPTLLRYLQASHQRLSRGNAGFGGGIMVADLYDGPGKYTLGSITRLHPGRGHETVRYTWEHRHADALTAMVTSAIHFQVEIEGEAVARYPDAFTYHWRLWSIPELREAMHEAGFTSTEVYQDVGLDAAPMESGGQMKESGIVCVVARA